MTLKALITELSINKKIQNTVTQHSIKATAKQYNRQNVIIIIIIVINLLLQSTNQGDAIGSYRSHDNRPKRVDTNQK